jgi:hypothetical protein
MGEIPGRMGVWVDRAVFWDLFEGVRTLKNPV